MATTITLTGRLADLTSQPIDPATTTVTVKAPAYAPGPGVELTTTQPATAPVGADGEITITAVEGVGWLTIDGPGWSDSIRFVAAPGMLTLWEAVVNALPHVVEVKRLLVALHEAYMSSEAGQALPTWLTEAALSSTYATKAEFLLALRDRVDPLVAEAIAADTTVRDAAEQAVSGAVAALPDTVLRRRGALTASSQIDTLTSKAQEGVYDVAATSVATSVGLPTSQQGDFTVRNLFSGTNNRAVQTWADVNGAYFVRHNFGTGWSAWSSQDTLTRERARTIAPGTDWNTLRAEGEWRRSRVSHTDPNAPFGGAANLIVFNPGHASNLVTQLASAISAGGLWYRTESLSGFTPWVRLDKPVGAASENPNPGAIAEGAARREFLLSDLRDRKGGTIGTGGKAAIAWRFDHHTDQFNRLVLPLLTQHGMPWAQALNSRTQGVGNNTMTWEQMQDAAIRTGGEVFNHGATHTDAQDQSAFQREIIDGRNELRSHLPLLPIDGWMQPGTGGSFGGLQPFATEANWTTEAGRTILAQHAIVYGYKPGMMKALDGQPSIGQQHLSMDLKTFEEIKTEIDRAVATRSGLVLMCHPNYLDEQIADTQLTLDVFTQVVEYVAALRAAGDLEVVSASGLQVCDVTHSYRRELVALDLTGSNALSGQRLKTGNTFAADGPHEVHAELTGTGDVLIEVYTADNALNVSKTVTLSGSATVWWPITIPTGASAVSVRVTGAASGRLVLRAV